MSYLQSNTLHCTSDKTPYTSAALSQRISTPSKTQAPNTQQLTSLNNYQEMRNQLKIGKQSDGFSLQSSYVSSVETPFNQPCLITQNQHFAAQNYSLNNIEMLNPENVDNQTILLKVKDTSYNIPTNIYQPTANNNNQWNSIRPEFSFQKAPIAQVGDADKYNATLNNQAVYQYQSANKEYPEVSNQGQINRSNLDEQNIVDIYSNEKQKLQDHNLSTHFRRYSSSSSKQESIQQQQPSTPKMNNNAYLNSQEVSHKTKDFDKISSDSDEMKLFRHLDTIKSNLDCLIRQLEEKLNEVTQIRRKYFDNMIKDIKREKEREISVIEKLIPIQKWNPLDSKTIDSLQRRIRDIGIEMNDLKDLHNTQTGCLPSIYYNPFRASKQFNNEFSSFLRRSNSASKLSTISQERVQSEHTPQIRERQPCFRIPYNDHKKFNNIASIVEQPENNNHEQYDISSDKQPKQNLWRDIMSNQTLNTNQSPLSSIFEQRVSPSHFKSITSPQNFNHEDKQYFDTTLKNQIQSPSNNTPYNMYADANQSKSENKQHPHTIEQENQVAQENQFNVEQYRIKPYHHSRAQSVGYNPKPLFLSNQALKQNYPYQMNYPYQFNQSAGKLQNESNNNNNNNNQLPYTEPCYHEKLINSSRLNSSRDYQNSMNKKQPYEESQLMECQFQKQSYNEQLNQESQSSHSKQSSNSAQKNENDEQEQEEFEEFQEEQCIKQKKNIQNRNSENEEDLEDISSESVKKQVIFSNQKRKSQESHQSSRYSNCNEEEDQQTYISPSKMQKQTSPQNNSRIIECQPYSNSKQLSPSKQIFSSNNKQNSYLMSSQKQGNNNYGNDSSQNYICNKNSDMNQQNSQSQKNNNNMFEQIIQSVKISQNDYIDKQSQTEQPFQFDSCADLSSKSQYPSHNEYKILKSSGITSQKRSKQNNLDHSEDEQIEIQHEHKSDNLERSKKTSPLENKNQIKEMRDIQQTSNDISDVKKIQIKVIPSQSDQPIVERDFGSFGQSYSQGSDCRNNQSEIQHSQQNIDCSLNRQIESELKNRESSLYNTNFQPQALKEINSFVSSQHTLDIPTASIINIETDTILNYNHNNNANNNNDNIANNNNNNIANNNNDNIAQNRIYNSHTTVNQGDCSFLSDKEPFRRISQRKYESFIKEEKQYQGEAYENSPNFTKYRMSVQEHEQKQGVDKDEYNEQNCQMGMQRLHNQTPEYYINNTHYNNKNNNNNSESVILHSNINKSMKENNTTINDSSYQIMSNSPKNNFSVSNNNNNYCSNSVQLEQQQSRDNMKVNQIQPYLSLISNQSQSERQNGGYMNIPTTQNIQSHPLKNHNSNMQTICEIIERQHTLQSSDLSDKYSSPNFPENYNQNSELDQSSPQKSKKNSSQASKQFSYKNESGNTSCQNQQISQPEQQERNQVNSQNLIYDQSIGLLTQSEQFYNEENNRINQQYQNISISSQSKFFLGQVKARIFLTDREFREFLLNKNALTSPPKPNSQNSPSNSNYNIQQNEDTNFSKCDLIYFIESQNLQLLFNSNLLYSTESNPAVVDSFQVSLININQTDIINCPNNQIYLKISRKNEPSISTKIILLQDTQNSYNSPATSLSEEDKYFTSKQNLQQLHNKIQTICRHRNNPEELTSQLIKQYQPNQSQYSEHQTVQDSHIKVPLQMHNNNDNNQMEEEEEQEESKICSQNNYIPSSQRIFNRIQQRKGETSNKEDYEIKQYNINESGLVQMKEINDRLSDFNQSERQQQYNTQQNLIEIHNEDEGDMKKLDSSMSSQNNESQRINQQNVMQDIPKESSDQYRERSEVSSIKQNNEGIIVVNNYEVQPSSDIPISIQNENNNIKNIFQISNQEGEQNQLSTIKRVPHNEDEEEQDSLTNQSEIKKFQNSSYSSQSLQEFEQREFNDLIGSQMIENKQNKQRNCKVQSQTELTQTVHQCSRFKAAQYYSRTAEEEELISFLKKFDEKEFIMKKYGQNSSSGQVRRIFFTSDFRFLCWKGITSPEIKRIIPVNSFKNYILHGRSSENFKRFKTSKQNDINCSFSIILHNRTIDLETLNIQDKELFIQGLQIIFRAFL